MLKFYRRKNARGLKRIKITFYSNLQDVAEIQGKRILFFWIKHDLRDYNFSQGENVQAQEMSNFWLNVETGRYLQFGCHVLKIYRQIKRHQRAFHSQLSNQTTKATIYLRFYIRERNWNTNIVFWWASICSEDSEFLNQKYNFNALGFLLYINSSAPGQSELAKNPGRFNLSYFDHKIKTDLRIFSEYIFEINSS